MKQIFRFVINISIILLFIFTDKISKLFVLSSPELFELFQTKIDTKNAPLKQSKHSIQSRSIRMPIFIESTYLIGFQYENILTVLELYYYNHTIYNCAIFDMKEQTRKKESRIYIKKFGHNKSYSKHHIDYNLMLLIIHSCTLYALKRYTNNILIKTDNSSKFFNDNDLKKDDNKFMDFIAPKTKWCGIDDVAKSYWDLGNQPLVDICCREHDHCPIHIKSKQTKHGLHNNNMFMVSYCQCEQFFYDCLHRRKGIHYEDVIRELYFLRFDVDCIDTIDCNAKWIFDNEKWKLLNFEKLLNEPCSEKFHIVRFKDYRKNRTTITATAITTDQNDNDVDNIDYKDDEHDDDNEIKPDTFIKPNDNNVTKT